MNRHIKQVLTTTRLSFLLWKRDLRVFALMIFVLVYLAIMERPLRQFSATIGIATAPWLLPFLVFPSGLALLMLVAVALFCSEPFGNPQFPLILIRIGRVNWVVGQLIYIFSASAVYTAFVTASSMVALFPYVRWTSEWGTVIDSYFLSSTPYDMGYPVAFQCAAYVYFELTPLKAVLLTDLLLFLTTFFIGTVVAFGNLILGGKAGVLLAALMICLSMIADIAGYISRVGEWLTYISPVSWGSLNGVVLHDPGRFPHIRYALIMDGILNTFLWVVIIMRFRKQDISNMPGGMSFG